jgi:DNA-binding beta-propeller fold protein YncE
MLWSKIVGAGGVGGGGVVEGWNISTAVFVQNFSVAAQETDPIGLFFKPDGTKMYVVGAVGDDVDEYDLSTAWNISTAVFAQSFSVAAQETVPADVFFKPDGLKMYVLGLAGDNVSEYDLSTAWDVSTAVFVQTFSVAAQDTTPFSLFFKPDGTKMYVVGAVGGDINEYDLSTAWDVSTAVFVQSFSVPVPFGLFFKPDGTKMYVVYRAGVVNEYDLSTAWNISTAVFLQNFSVVAQDSNPLGLFFKPDGTKMYVLGRTGLDINEYDLTA